MLRTYYQPPGEHLRAYIRSFYGVEAQLEPGEQLSDIAIPESANLRFVLEGAIQVEMSCGARQTFEVGAFLVGPTSKHMRFTFLGPARVVGFGITPIGWASLTSCPAHDFANKIASAQPILGEQTEIFFQALLKARDFSERFACLSRALIARRVQRPLPVSPLLNALENILKDKKFDRVEAIAHALAISPRHLERLMLRAYGFGPKLILRRRRFLEAFHYLRRRSGAGWMDAAGEEYCDQSHFIRDFKAFTGVSPSVYFARAQPVMAAVVKKTLDDIGQNPL
jgi:AraC-like DNA-binding protein